MSKRLIVGVSGASGTVYADRLLKAAKAAGCETHVVVSRAAKMTIAYEMGEGARFEGADVTYGINDVGAPIASGSFKTLGMVVVPCSVKTMSEIATGVTSTLLTRAADVCLKERRTLSLMVRETPFHLGHLRTMTSLAEMGAIIAPPLPAFYAEPQSIEEMVDQSVGRVLDQFGIEAPGVKRWGEDLEKGRR
ncbi:UbiX family flavin prenyltransferase [Parvularcula sp. ZS-1/3]|uniref:Flavin prenyltransferase UbiX n=1 Tax=Parvularcula mediterranea TaxID=2732508 RepID=A0A7Y3RNR1_9PROT|nr:UbiX family flavin prenyltransferase [Parvularcula mediterranea]NNU17477.1 UbiX family flavin prenyltransferase [Parvularcula mediterranea]